MSLRGCDLRLVARALLLLVFVQLFATGACAADTTQSTSALSFVARPYAKARNYVIYDVGLKTRVSGARNLNGDGAGMLTVDLGLMHNLNRKTAIGLSLYGSTSDQLATFGIRPRLRRWLDDSRGLDVSAGLLFTGGDGSYNSGNYKWPGFVGSVSVDLFRMVAMDLTLETLRFQQPSSLNPDGKSSTSLYLGVTTKDYAAIGSTVVVAAFVAVLVSAFNRQY